MAKAITVAEAAVELLPALSEKPDDEKSPAELLMEGMRAGLILARDICRRVQKALAEDAEGVDLKLLNLGSTTSGWLCRLGIRAAEGEFRARKDDVMGRLLAQMAAEKAKPGG